MQNLDDLYGPNGDISPFERFSRERWDALASRTPLPLNEGDIERIASLGDPIDMAEVDAIYRPLSAVLQLYVDANRRVGSHLRSLLQEPHTAPTPFIIGVAGSVAVGKSTVSRLLRLLLTRWPRTPRVDLITTDGFLYPNQHLLQQGLMDRKGFPESYDRQALLHFIAGVKAGNPHMNAPVYSHVTYDIVPDETVTISQPDILIVEGLNVLAPSRATPDAPGVTVADYFDFTIYVDADPEDVERWYVTRFLQLRATAFSNPDSYFHAYAELDDRDAVATARRIWRTINMPNLIENVAPTKPRATLILHKDSDHRVDEISLRKV